MDKCVFCKIIKGKAPAKIRVNWPNVLVFEPLGPVTPGHALVVPKAHVNDAAEYPDVTAMVMFRAAELAATYSSANIITSIGKPATQSIFHLHVHVIPRHAGDQLMVPWGTTGDPQKPHRCKYTDELEKMHRGHGTPCEDDPIEGTCGG